MSHFPGGLPPLPKSLSGFSFVENSRASVPPTPVRSSSIRSNPRQVKVLGSLEGQLAVLRREMYSLRQQDLSLLSQLWSLNESIQEFRQMLQEQRILSPPSPSPTASSVDEEEFYMSSTSMG
ncbi:protein FAM89A [Euwallacea fornicatus]|uniref:protein FAM89A n=1 Tax=Euwallacea fornicatus TaxID=995702 RepID=UPI00338E4A95